MTEYEKDGGKADIIKPRDKLGNITAYIKVAKVKKIIADSSLDAEQVTQLYEDLEITDLG